MVRESRPRKNTRATKGRSQPHANDYIKVAAPPLAAVGIARRLELAPSRLGRKRWVSDGDVTEQRASRGILTLTHTSP